MENQADRQSYTGKQWIFIIKTGIEGGSLIRVENLSEKEKKMFCSMDIGQLTEELFRLPVFLNEVV